MLALTLVEPTRWHRLPAGPKLAGLAGFASTIAVIDSPVLLAGAAALSVLPWLTEGSALRRQFMALALRLSPVLMLLCGWHALRGTPAEAAGPALRMAAAFAAATLVTATTRLSALVEGVERLLYPFRHLGVEPGTVALAVALVIRSIPMLMHRADRLAAASRARSLKRPSWRLALPLALAALDDADRTAEALRARRADH